MRINQISNNNFEGKAKFNPNLPANLKNYANHILDTVVEGKTVRQKLAEKTFDMTFFTTSSKKAINPKLEYYSGFKVLNPKDEKYYNSRVRVNDDFYENAKKVSDFIDRMGDRKQSYDGYNTFGERVKIFVNDVFEFLLDKW